ncbi:MAG TPA: hypothetical protein VFC22_03085, partial [Solirubrobacteraceae bacterium]|nr:hypothetical protein [Solirubrobacteraceae bacterium]
MRRGLTWLVAVPLLVAGSQAAHALTYRLIYPGTPVRVHALALTGHGYLDRLPLALGVALAIALVALLVAVLDASRGRQVRALPAWAFAVLAPLAFALQEILELSLHAGTMAWHAIAAPTFLPGLALQLPFSFLAWFAARLLLRAAGRAGRALTARPPVARPLSLVTPARAGATLPRARVLAYRLAKRGPPLP